MKLCPRFSIRTLAIFVTLVCAYFGAWEATKEHVDAENMPNFAFFSRFPANETYSSPIPFLVQKRSIRGELRSTGYTRMITCKQHYLWLFGPKVTLALGSTTVTNALQDAEAAIAIRCFFDNRY